MTRRTCLYAALLLLLPLGLGTGGNPAGPTDQKPPKPPGKEQAAQAFVNTLYQQDPRYFAAKSGLRSLSCKISFKVGTHLDQALRHSSASPGDEGTWTVDYFWMAPNYSYIPAPSWRPRSAKPVTFGDEPLELIPRGLLEFHPYPYRQFHLNYEHDPAQPLPHRLWGPCRSEDLKAITLDLGFDAGLALRRHTLVSAHRKLYRRDFDYETVPAGLLLKSFRNVDPAGRLLWETRYEYALEGGYHLPRQIRLDCPPDVDTPLRQALPVILELTGFRLNEPVPPAIRSHLSVQF